MMCIADQHVLIVSVFTQVTAEAQRTAARAARSAYIRTNKRHYHQACCSNRDPLLDKIREVGRGALARRQTDGPLCAAVLKTTVMCEAWRRRSRVPPDPPLTSCLASSADPYN